MKENIKTKKRNKKKNRERKRNRKRRNRLQENDEEEAINLEESVERYARFVGRPGVSGIYRTIEKRRPS